MLTCNVGYNSGETKYTVITGYNKYSDMIIINNNPTECIVYTVDRTVVDSLREANIEFILKLNSYIIVTYQYSRN